MKWVRMKTQSGVRILKMKCLSRGHRLTCAVGVSGFFSSKLLPCASLLNSNPSAICRSFHFQARRIGLTFRTLRTEKNYFSFYVGLSGLLRRCVTIYWIGELKSEVPVLTLECDHVPVIFT